MTDASGSGRGPRPPSCGTWTARSSTPSRTGWRASASSSTAYGGTWTEDDAHSIIGFDLLDAAVVLRDRGGVDSSRTRSSSGCSTASSPASASTSRGGPGARRLLRELNDLGVPCALVTMSWRRLVDADPRGAGADPRSTPSSPATTCRARQAAPGAVPRGGRRRSASTPTSASPSRTPPPAWRRRRRPAASSRRPAHRGRSTGAGPLRRRQPQVGHAGRPRRATSPRRRRRRHAGAPPTADRVGGRRPPALAPSSAAPPCSSSSSWRRSSRRVSSGGDDAAPAAPAGRRSTSTRGRRTGRSTTALPDLDARADTLHELSPFWFRTTGVDTIAVEAQTPTDQADQFIDTARRHQVPLVASILDGTEAGVMAGILADPAQRARHVDAIADVRRRRRLRRHRHRLRAVRLRRRPRHVGDDAPELGGVRRRAVAAAARRRAHADRQHPAGVRRRPDRRQRLLGLRLRGDHAARRHDPRHGLRLLGRRRASPGPIAPLRVGAAA